MARPLCIWGQISTLDNLICIWGQISTLDKLIHQIKVITWQGHYVSTGSDLEM